MLKISPDSRIYVYAPAGVVTGGAELLHQLVDFLNRNGRDACILYLTEKYAVAADARVPDDYACYRIKTAVEVENSPKNVEVFYEADFHLAGRNSRTQKMLWWLSVDNFFSCSRYFIPVRELMGFSRRLALKQLFHRLTGVAKGKRRGFPKFSLRKLAKTDVLSAYQSEYAQHFLKNKGFREICALKDYINTEHTAADALPAKENIVLYNPKKGFAFTKKIIARMSDVDFVAVANMNRAQVIDLMRRAKVYIDFGNHPGKDRMPRECAANGCVVITGSRGSAGFFEDVMIPNKYKFDERTASLDDICGVIKESLTDYDSAIGDFGMYRRMIMREKQEFENQIRLIFNIPFTD